MTHVVITTVEVPGTHGGAEVLVEGLHRELEARGYSADIFQLSYLGQPKESLVEHIAAWQAIDLSEYKGRKVDLVIGTKFPSYLVRHRRKVVWLVHQHRLAYDLYGSAFSDFETTAIDEARRELLMDADRVALAKASCYAISANVAARLERYLGLNAEVLLPPLPLGKRYYQGEKGDYILSVGRICSIKRVDLLVRALPLIDPQLKVKVVGTADEPITDCLLRQEIDRHELWPRIELLGRVDDETLLSLYANAFAVYYAPYDEDYGYVTLEALASGKAVITAWDSGGVLGFIRNRENGLIGESNPESIANCVNELLNNNALYQQLNSNISQETLPQDWNHVIRSLVGAAELKS